MNDFCQFLSAFLFNHIKFSISIAGFCLNLINIIIFIKINRLKTQSNDNFFKYLLIKSICDCYVMAFGVIFGVLDIYYNQTIVQKYYELCIFRWIFDEYLCFVCQLISMFCEVASSFNRYRSITNKFQFLNKISFKFKLLFILIYCFGFYTYKYVQKKCNFSKSGNSTIVKLEIPASFFNSPTDFGISLTHGLIRDGLCSVIIIILNLLTFIYMNEFLTSKMELHGRKVNIKIERAQKNLTYMVFSTSCFTLIGHLLMFVYYLPVQVLRDNRCLRSFSLLFFYFSFSINALFYYIFNLHYKSLINKYLCTIIGFISFNYIKFNQTKKIKYENTIKTTNF